MGKNQFLGERNERIKTTGMVHTGIQVGGRQARSIGSAIGQRQPDEGGDAAKAGCGALVQ
jgi:hypothetical protein